MNLAMLRLPIVARELTELAQRKSTYRLRCLGVGLPMFVALLVLIGSQAQGDSWGDMVGSGRRLYSNLFFSLLVVLYLVAPAICCSAITSEKEKQTLGLLLISKLSPLSLVLEKSVPA